MTEKAYYQTYIKRDGIWYEYGYPTKYGRCSNTLWPKLTHSLVATDIDNRSNRNKLQR